MRKLRTSRRIPPLKDSDYDHEIILADEDVSEGELSPGSPSKQRGAKAATTHLHEVSIGAHAETAGVSVQIPVVQTIPPTPGAPEPPTTSQPARTSPISLPPTRSRSRQRSTDIAVDILYENERGGILCGMYLFSSKALGNLDPAPWTNEAQKPSLTNTHTATVPDPSWEWAWPTWKINQSDKADENGWEYSFMFSKKFSWHAPRWWNSFVRRRVWVRRRRRREHNPDCDGHSVDDSCMLTADYFTIRPASQVSMCSRTSKLASQRSSVHSAVRVSDKAELPSQIEDTDTLLRALKAARIDREKIEAVENYIQHGKDNIEHLQDIMHDIMSMFVFQSSRKALLSRLMQLHDESVSLTAPDGRPPSQHENKPAGGTELGNESRSGSAVETQAGSSTELAQRAEHIAAAIKHADEEVKKLEYWSDIKAVEERGESHVEGCKGTRAERFESLDRNAPTGP